jgi:hypothetical protein
MIRLQIHAYRCRDGVDQVPYIGSPFVGELERQTQVEETTVVLRMQDYIDAARARRWGELYRILRWPVSDGWSVEVSVFENGKLIEGDVQ